MLAYESKWLHTVAVKGRAAVATVVFCILSSSAYIIGRCIHMRAEHGSNACCFASESVPFLNGARAILRGVDPYGYEVTRENDILYNNRPFTNNLGTVQLAYPLFAVLPFAPIGVLGFPAASRVMFAAFCFIPLLCVGWIRGRWDQTTLLLGLLALASYPIAYDVYGVQPTLIFFALAVLATRLFISERFIWAALAAAFALGKPHIAIPLLLPAIIYALAKCREFIFWLCGFLGIAVAGSLAVRPDWIESWLTAIRAYADYSPRPLLLSLFDPVLWPLVILVTAIVGLLLAVAARNRGTIFQASVSAIFFYPLIPYRPYNAAVLLVPLVWLADHREELDIMKIAVWTLCGSTAFGAALQLTASWKTGFALPIVALDVVFIMISGALFRILWRYVGLAKTSPIVST